MEEPLYQIIPDWAAVLRAFGIAGAISAALAFGVTWLAEKCDDGEPYDGE